MPRLNNRLRELSAQKGSIARVCRDLEINRQQFNRYLSGEIIPRPAMLQKLARYFSVSMDALMGQEAGPPPKLARMSAADDFAARTAEVFAGILRKTQAKPPFLLKNGFYIQHFLLRRGEYFLLSMPVTIQKTSTGEVVFKRSMNLYVENSKINCNFSGGIFSIEEKNHIFYSNTTMNNSMGMFQISHQIFGYPHLYAGLYLVKSSLNHGDTMAGRTILEYLGPELKFSQFRHRLGCWSIDSKNVPDIIRAKLMPKGRVQVMTSFEME